MNSRLRQGVRHVMRLSRSKKVVALLAVALIAAATATMGISAVISRTVLADGQTLHYSTIKFVADDYDSGWLVHSGLVVIQVQEGALQVTQGSCTAKTVGAGETFIKVPFSPVHGISTGRVVFTATYLIPNEQPLFMSAKSPCP